LKWVAPDQSGLASFGYSGDVPEVQLPSRPSLCPVWVVEDDSAVRASLKFALEVEGYGVFLFESGATALLAAAQAIPCCRLIVDYGLPDMDGVQLVTELSATGVKGRPVFMTTAPNERLRRMAKSLNAAIVEKPLMQDRLLPIIGQMGCACGAAT